MSTWTVGDTERGFDSTHLPADAATQALREQQRRTARANLAAEVFERNGVDVHAADHDPAAIQAALADIREIADILGLTPGPARRAGYCACGTELPMIAASNAVSSKYLHGHCRPCSLAAGAATTPPTPTARCPYCRRDYHLGANGRFRVHSAWVRRGGRDVRLTSDCRGSHTLPGDCDA